MEIYAKTKGTPLEKTISQLAAGEAMGGAMYYALAKFAKENLGLDDVAKELIELGNQETNHGAFYASLNGKYPHDEQAFWRMLKGLSKAEYKGESSVNALAGKLCAMGLAEAAEQVKVFAAQEKHHGEALQSIIEKYAPKNAEICQAKKPVYVCKVCGFEYEGDLSQEPDGYLCPVCGMPKSVFELQE
ncbi:MAG: hypothetical protein J6P03_01605 [Opitutales bacterium]|nr:hypothetical protein [Opitutales bacterium]